MLLPEINKYLQNVAFAFVDFTVFMKDTLLAYRWGSNKEQNVGQLYLSLRVLKGSKAPVQSKHQCPCCWMSLVDEGSQSLTEDEN